MANSAAVCTSFKLELLQGYHAFSTGPRAADTFKLALFLASGSLGASTTAYSTTSELAGTGNYTQGGKTVSGTAALDGTTAHWTPSASLTWTALTSSGTFDAALLYNSTQTNRAVAVFDFADQSVTAGDFTITMPTDNGTTGLIRVG